MSSKLSPVSEKDISSAIDAEFAVQFREYVENDCIIVGGGSSGLMADSSWARIVARRRTRL